MNVEFNYQGKLRALLIASGSVDQKDTYVFEVHPQGILESVAKTLSYWSTGDGDDTMITLWNPADEEQDFVFTLFFSGGHYKYPVHLGPKASHAFNVSDIIQNRIPDDEGNIIPASVHEGSAEITGLQGESEHILVSLDAGIYNVQKATCSDPMCITCQGAVDSWMDLNPFAVAVGGKTQQTFSVQYHSGTLYDLTQSAAWSSIGTVSAGLVTGVSAGSLSLDATDDFTPVYFHACYAINPDGSCPQVMGVQAGGGGSVAQLNCTSSVTRGGTVTCTVTPSSATVSGWQFKDSSGNTVSRTVSPGSLTWSGAVVIGGTVSVTATVSGAAIPLSKSIAVTNRTNFAFTAANPAQLTGTNSITCYDGTITSLASPPNATSFKGASCADLAFSFNDAPISDNGPNNGYQYVTSVSDVNGNQATQFPYIVVSDLLSATTFYNHQCGNYSSSNSAGFIAGSQLKQNVFDHEQGSILSHWTQYRDAQNNPSNNVGTVLEAMTAPPGTAQTTYESNLRNAGQSAQNNIVAAAGNEVALCNGDPTKDSSQSCAACGAINYSPYKSCVPYCH